MKLTSNYPRISRGKIIVWGLLASHPFGGMTWQVLHYVVGLRRLGFDVWYVEDSDNALLDSETHWGTVDYTKNVHFLKKHMENIGLKNKWVFRPPKKKEECIGALNASGLKTLYKEADALINLCGANYLRPDHTDIGCLIYMQTDPFVDQVRICQGDEWLKGQLDRYKYLFTYAENIYNSDCSIPDDGYHWLKTRPPVCIDWWTKNTNVSSGEALTTISNWKNLNNDIIWEGESYTWRKDIEFLKFLELPSKSKLPIELSLEGIKEADIQKLLHHGWRIASARALSDPFVYREYIRNSLGEFTVAKDQYVRPKTGWFSDRSVCYLASGRPVITHETGFSKYINTGNGLFSFKTEEDILAAVDAIKTDFEGQCKSANEIANEYFAAEKVIGSMMDKVGL